MFDSRILTIDNNGFIHIDNDWVKNAAEYMKFDGNQIDKFALKWIQDKLKESNA